MPRHSIRLIPNLTTSLGLSLAASLALGQSSHQPYIAPAHVPSGPTTYIPQDPARPPKDAPGKHVLNSEDSFGDRIQSTYTLPPMHPTPAPQGRVSINDPLWGITAATIEQPAGWTFVGSVHRDNPCSPEDPEVAFRLKSPDGITIDLMTPFFTSSVVDYRKGLYPLYCGLKVSGHLSAAAILTRYILPSLYPGALILSTPEDTPRTADWVKQATGPLGADTTTAEAKRIRIGLTLHGRPSEAWVAVQTRFLHGATYEASISEVTTVVAPTGRLDEATKIAETLNLQIDPEWTRRENERSAAALAQRKRGFRYPAPPARDQELKGLKPDADRQPVDPRYHPSDYQNQPPPPSPQP